MELQQLCGCDWLAAVLLNKQPKFLLRVDAPFVSSGFYQRRFRCLVLAKEDRVLERLAVNHAEGQSQECQQALLVIWKDLRERPRPTFSRFHGEGIRRFEAEF